MKGTVEDQILNSLYSRLQKAFQDINYICAKFMASKEARRNKMAQQQGITIDEANKETEKTLKKSKSTQKNKSKSKPKLKDNNIPPKPRQPLSTFFMFQQEKRADIKKQYPHLSQVEIVEVMTQVWKSLQEEDKKPYEDRYKLAKEAYQKDLDQYYMKYPNERRKVKERIRKAEKRRLQRLQASQANQQNQ